MHTLAPLINSRKDSAVPETEEAEEADEEEEEEVFLNALERSCSIQAIGSSRLMSYIQGNIKENESNFINFPALRKIFKSRENNHAFTHTHFRICMLHIYVHVYMSMSLCIVNVYPTDSITTTCFVSGRTVEKAKVSEPPSQATTVPTRAMKCFMYKFILEREQMRWKNRLNRVCNRKD